ncbi:MAG TPA: IPT/TIG domain-containing protein, partial [Membranihabitans sp.]|nr:IPT/TIG domain-containing protein [Membranihabitans sp.]
QGGTTGPVSVRIDDLSAVGPVFTYLQANLPQILSISPGEGGDHTQNNVTITGKNFGKDKKKLKVTFDGSEATIKSNSETKLVVGPPKHAPGKVKVIAVVDGQSSNSVFYTYREKASDPPKPEILSISPTQGGDHTQNNVAITGKHFGKDKTKVKVTFGGVNSSIESFSDTKITAGPPEHAPGKVNVIVQADGVSSNSVTYTYQSKPEILDVYTDSWNRRNYYFVSSKNLAATDGEISLTINGIDATVSHIFREGTPQYQKAPVGDKIITPVNVGFQIGYVSIMNFVVSSSGQKSTAFRYINEPVITSIEPRYGEDIEPGSDVIILGKYLGNGKESSTIEIWDSIYSKHFLPDPNIILWNEERIRFSFSFRYDLPPGRRKLGLVLKTNGKSTNDLFQYLKACPLFQEIYTGEYKYPNYKVYDYRPYGIRFNSDGTMVFTDTRGDFPGTYTYDCTSGQVVMDFADHKMIVKATRGSNALTHFSYIQSPGYTFVRAQLNTTWDQNLDGTKWGAPTTDYRFEFGAGNAVRFQGDRQWGSYSRKNGTIKIFDFFGIIEKDKMTLSTEGYRFEIMKE